MLSRKYENSHKRQQQASAPAKNLAVSKAESPTRYLKKPKKASVSCQSHSPGGTVLEYYKRQGQGQNESLMRTRIGESVLLEETPAAKKRESPALKSTISKAANANLDATADFDLEQNLQEILATIPPTTPEIKMPARKQTNSKAPIEKTEENSIHKGGEPEGDNQMKKLAQGEQFGLPPPVVHASKQSSKLPEGSSDPNLTPKQQEDEHPHEPPQELPQDAPRDEKDVLEDQDPCDPENHLILAGLEDSNVELSEVFLNFNSQEIKNLIMTQSAPVAVEGADDVKESKGAASKIEKNNRVFGSNQYLRVPGMQARDTPLSSIKQEGSEQGSISPITPAKSMMNSYYHEKQTRFQHPGAGSSSMVHSSQGFVPQPSFGKPRTISGGQTNYGFESQASGPRSVPAQAASRSTLPPGQRSPMQQIPRHHHPTQAHSVRNNNTFERSQIESATNSSLGNLNGAHAPQAVWPYYAPGLNGQPVLVQPYPSHPASFGVPSHHMPGQHLAPSSTHKQGSNTKDKLLDLIRTKDEMIQNQIKENRRYSDQYIKLLEDQVQQKDKLVLQCLEKLAAVTEMLTTRPGSYGSAADRSDGAGHYFDPDEVRMIPKETGSKKRKISDGTKSTVREQKPEEKTGKKTSNASEQKELLQQEERPPSPTASQIEEVPQFFIGGNRKRKLKIKNEDSKAMAESLFGNVEEEAHEDVAVATAAGGPIKATDLGAKERSERDPPPHLRSPDSTTKKTSASHREKPLQSSKPSAKMESEADEDDDGLDQLFKQFKKNEQQGKVPQFYCPSRRPAGQMKLVTNKKKAGAAGAVHDTVYDTAKDSSKDAGKGAGGDELLSSALQASKVENKNSNGLEGANRQEGELPGKDESLELFKDLMDAFFLPGSSRVAPNK